MTLWGEASVLLEGGGLYKPHKGRSGNLGMG